MVLNPWLQMEHVLKRDGKFKGLGLIVHLPGNLGHIIHFSRPVFLFTSRFIFYLWGKKNLPQKSTTSGASWLKLFWL